MSNNIQIKIFFGIVLLAFFGAFYYRDNLSPKAKDQKFLKDSDEAINVCLENYPDTTSQSLCAMRYLRSVKGYSYEELNKRAARQGYF
jgi:hypothetical protein